MITLRQDQQALSDGIDASWANGNRNVLAVLPTGGGKSVVMSHKIKLLDDLQAHQAVIAHRTELVGQMATHVARRGIPHRIIGPAQTIADITAEQRRQFGRSFVNPSARCAVAGVDTIMSRAEELKPWGKQVSCWYVDEAHHLLRANKWGKAVELFPNAYGLGVTATPKRADGMGLGSHHDGVFDDMIVGPSMRWLIDHGALCEYQIVVPDSDFQIDDSAITGTGDYSSAKMKEASEKSHIVGDVVQEYCKWAFGKRGIVFATDVETSLDMAAKFNSAGIPAAAVSAKTPAHTRNEYIRRFQAGEIWILVNVDLFGEGFDVPAIEVVIMARPTASLAVYLQQFGRALRILSGKQFGLVIDHVSNYKRHGLPDQERLWTLDRREKREKQEKDPEFIELTRCRACSRPMSKADLWCKACGAVPPVPEPRLRSIEVVDGNLTLLTPEMLDELRKAAVLDSPESISSQARFVAGPAAGAGVFKKQVAKLEAQKRLDDALNAWAGVQRYLGRPDEESYKRFYITTGIDVISARAQSASDMNKIAERVEGWIK